MIAHFMTLKNARQVPAGSIGWNDGKFYARGIGEVILSEDYFDDVDPKDAAQVHALFKRLPTIFDGAYLRCDVRGLGTGGDSVKHHGPGPHASGSPQSVHGSGGARGDSDHLGWLKNVTGKVHTPMFSLGRQMSTDYKIKEAGAEDVLAWWAESYPDTDFGEFVSAYEFKHTTGFSADVSSIGLSSGDLVVSGYAYAPDMSPIGEFQVKWSGHGVHHAHLVIDPEYQSLGLAGFFVERLEDRYEKIGVKRITMMANYDVGGYAWARMGYDFAKPRHYMAAIVSGNIGRAMTEAGIRKDSAHHERLGKLESSWDLATFEAEGRRFGKEAMMRTTWVGVKNLGGEGDAVGQAYFDAKMRKFQSGKAAPAPTPKPSKEKNKKGKSKPGWFITPEGGDAALWPDIDGPVDDAWFEAVRKLGSTEKVPSNSKPVTQED